jgi:hypothetical protein
MKLPQFTLRDLFWLILATSLGLAWWIDRTRLAAAKSAAEDDAHSLGIMLGFSPSWDVSPSRAADLKRKYEGILGGRD